VDENVPPVRYDPLVIAPVVKLTEPWTPVWLPQLVSCEPFELMPAFEIAIVPNSFVISIPLAQAAIGNANASNAKTTTRLI
jgi:hypothetical protein